MLRIPMNLPATKAARPRSTPNLALRQVRKACGMSQSAFAALLGVSAPHVQAVELGQRAVSVDLAGRVRDRTGASARCILEGWTNAIDTEGHPYTMDTYQILLSKQPVSPSDDQLRSLWESMNAVLTTAAAAGKSALALSIIRDKLQEATEHILVLDGVSEVLASQLFAGGRPTPEKPRKHPEQTTSSGTGVVRALIHMRNLHAHQSPTPSKPDDDRLSGSTSNSKAVDEQSRQNDGSQA